MKRHNSNDKFLLGVFIALLVCILAYSTCSRAGENVEELIRQEAQRQHFNPDIAVAVATVESNLDQNAVGEKGEIGVFQILPYVAPGANLFDLKTNIYWGIRHLRYWQRVCPTVEGISFVNCYNSGFRRPRYPMLRPYVRKVAAVLELL